jgi:hypothetical protein
VPPASATALLGPAGGVLMIIMLFMAITSTGSAECIAVASLVAYDIYRQYINKAATGSQILMYSRIVVCIWALLMACFSLILNAMGLGLGWVYNFMGICIGSAVTPIAMCVTNKDLGPKTAIVAALTGFVAALIAWLSQAAAQGGKITVDTTGLLYAQLAGNCIALGSSFIICIVGSLLFPQNFDWDVMVKGISLVAGDGGENANTLGSDYERRPEFLLEARAWIMKYGIGWTAFLTLGWPLLSIPFGVFGKSTYQLWASVALCWGWVAGVTIIVMPLYENLKTIIRVFTCNPMSAEEVQAKASGAATETATA